MRTKESGSSAHVQRPPQIVQLSVGGPASDRLLAEMSANAEDGSHAVVALSRLAIFAACYIEPLRASQGGYCSRIGFPSDDGTFHVFLCPFCTLIAQESCALYFLIAPGDACFDCFLFLILAFCFWLGSLFLTFLVSVALHSARSLLFRLPASMVW